MMLDHKSGLGGLINLASRFGVGPGWAQMLGRAMLLAPEPTNKVLGKDWLKNLDVYSHGIGCMASGIFDSITEDMTAEQIAELDYDTIKPLLPEKYRDNMFARSAFDTCKMVYAEYGSVSKAILDGKITAEGLVGQSILAPMAEKQLERSQDAKPKIFQLLESKGKDSTIL